MKKLNWNYIKKAHSYNYVIKSEDKNLTYDQHLGALKMRKDGQIK